jgi:hypothetical protein
MRRNILPAALLLASCAIFSSACGGGETRVNNASGGNSNAAGGTSSNAAPGAREGAGPHNAGIGGTGEDNRAPAASGNSNVEPTGVNKNAGRASNGNTP